MRCHRSERPTHPVIPCVAAVLTMFALTVPPCPCAEEDMPTTCSGIIELPGVTVDHRMGGVFASISVECNGKEGNRRPASAHSDSRSSADGEQRRKLVGGGLRELLAP